MTTGLFAIAEHITFDLPLAEAETIALHVVPLRLESVTLAIKKNRERTHLARPLATQCCGRV